MFSKVGAPINLTGQRFGKVVALESTKQRKPNGEVIWKCRCDCGNIFFTGTSTLRYGTTKSCGCARLEKLKANPPKKKHGGSEDRLYRVWRGMIDRCYYPSSNRYRNYGARGIQICQEWRHDYSAFRTWALNNGYEKDAKRGQCTIDRIDVNGNYEPSNCRWVSMEIQSKNKRQKGVF